MRKKGKKKLRTQLPPTTKTPEKKRNVGKRRKREITLGYFYFHINLGAN